MFLYMQAGNGEIKLLAAPPAVLTRKSDGAGHIFVHIYIFTYILYI